MRLTLLISVCLILASGPLQAQDQMEPDWIDRSGEAGPLFPNQLDSAGTGKCGAWFQTGSGATIVPHDRFRDAPYNYEEERVEGDGPEVVRYRASDACGLRFSNLNGAWEIQAANLGTQIGRFFNIEGEEQQYGQERQQLLVSHDRETGAFSARLLYVPPDKEPRRSFGIGVGDLLLEGQLSADDMWLDGIGYFSLADRKRCPAATRYRLPVDFISLSYQAYEDKASTPLLRLHWPMMDVAEDCSFSIRKRGSPLSHNWINFELPERVP